MLRYIATIEPPSGALQLRRARVARRLERRVRHEQRGEEIKLIPTIETIVEDLAAGTISKQQAIVWLHIHAEDAGMDLRDSFAMAALAHSSTNCDDAANDVKNG